MGDFLKDLDKHSPSLGPGSPSHSLGRQNLQNSLFYHHRKASDKKSTFYWLIQKPYFSIQPHSSCSFECVSKGLQFTGTMPKVVMSSESKHTIRQDSWKKDLSEHNKHNHAAHKIHTNWILRSWENLLMDLSLYISPFSYAFSRHHYCWQWENMAWMDLQYALVKPFPQECKSCEDLKSVCNDLTLQRQGGNAWIS